MPYTYSVLRYPGGKSQLKKYVSHLLKINKISGTYIEPFAGGFGLGLYLLIHEKVNTVVMNDLDPSIYSIWNAILNRKNELVDLINQTDVTIDEWYKQKGIRKKYCNDPLSIENAFSTLFLNRTNVSGIINGGPIGGKNQNGKYKINCRFNKTRLIEKIDLIYQYKNKIILYNENACDFISNDLGNFSSTSTFIFFDPPYFKQGKKLYLSFVDKKDHAKLAEKILGLNEYNWILTYDKEKEIFDLYNSYATTFEYKLRYSANNKRVAKEYMFSCRKTKMESYDKVLLHKL